MNFNLFELWEALQFLPPLFAYALFALSLFLVATLLIMPLGMLILSEPKQLFGWFSSQRQQLATNRTDGASSLECYLRAIVMLFDGINVVVGRLVAWLALFMVLLQFIVVIMRYVFSWGSIQLQESIWYMHGILFMLGAAYCLYQDGHVRVDILYRDASEKRKALVNLLGVIFFLLPLCGLIGYFSWSYIMNSWEVMEGSTEGSGLPYIYLFKSVIMVFVVLMVIQGVSMAIKSTMTLLGMSTDGLMGDKKNA